MAVYVDDMFKTPMGRFGRMKMSRMIADTDAELHIMADRIGVARRWFQGDHYDISLSRRARAIDAGAVPVPMRQIASMRLLRRLGLPMGDPTTAFVRYRGALDERRATVSTGL